MSPLNDLHTFCYLPIALLFFSAVPVFLISNQLVSLGGNSVFTCYDTEIYNNNQYNVKWFKDGVQVSVIPEKIDLFEEILFIQNVTTNDIGDYNCQLQTYDNQVVATSKKKLLKITTGKICCFVF